MIAYIKQLPLIGSILCLGLAVYERTRAIQIRNDRLEAKIIERLKAEQQFRQDQKIEAIRTLAGGVAHEFNNQMGIIIGTVDQLLDEVDANDPLKEDLERVFRAAEQSASYTSRLLSYSLRQVLRPETIDLNVLTAEQLQECREILPDNIGLTVMCHQPAAPVEVDPVQLKLALLNLVHNARDAMPAGGQVTLRVNHITTTIAGTPVAGMTRGEYVELSVHDTGHGLKDSVKDQIFDPFFTTKAVGKGIGLSLAMVNGFVSQSGGFISVESQADKGTTFKLYFPLTAEEAAPMMMAQTG